MRDDDPNGGVNNEAEHWLVEFGERIMDKFLLVRCETAGWA